MKTGEISSHFAEAYGASVSKDTITWITDKVLEEMSTWWSQPLERVYAALFIDVSAREGPRWAGRAKPFYAHEWGVDLDGGKDILAMVPGVGETESSKFWMSVLTDIKNRGC